MKKIPLYSKKYPGLFALIDDEDFDLVNQYRWNPFMAKSAKTFCALGHIPGKGSSKRPLIYMHRLILNAPKGMDVDHKNHNGLINQRYNIRICTRNQNVINATKRRKTSSRFKGVSWHKQARKWMSRATLNKKRIYLGLFNDEIIAAKEYDKKTIELHGEYALTNF